MKKIFSMMLGLLFAVNVYGFDLGSFTEGVLKEVATQAVHNQNKSQRKESGGDALGNVSSEVGSADFQTQSVGYGPKQVVNGKTYNLAFLDLKKRGNLIQDELRYKTKHTRSGTYDNKHLMSLMDKSGEGTHAVISGYIEIPKSITTNKVYISAGRFYKVRAYPGARDIYYNNNIQQDSEFISVPVERDDNNNRAVKYTVVIRPSNSSNLKNRPNLLPGNLKFKIAPAKRGFQNKFQTAKIYVLEDA